MHTPPSNRMPQQPQGQAGPHPPLPHTCSRWASAGLLSDLYRVTSELLLGCRETTACGARVRLKRKLNFALSLLPGCSAKGPQFFSQGLLGRTSVTGTNCRSGHSWSLSPLSSGPNSRMKHCASRLQGHAKMHANLYATNCSLSQQATCRDRSSRTPGSRSQNAACKHYCRLLSPHVL